MPERNVWIVRSRGVMYGGKTWRQEAATRDEAKRIIAEQHTIPIYYLSSVIATHTTQGASAYRVQRSKQR